jgi:RES domain-containing protein
VRHVERGGSYYRVCKPGGTECADTAHSRLHGGRWNAPGEHGVLHLNRTVRMAALQAHDRFRGEAHSLFDLRPERRPDLQAFEVERAAYVDAVTDSGLEALGLPPAYPEGAGWERCRPLGRAAFEAGERGIACRTACAGGGDPDHEELALFDRGSPLATPGERWPFARWFPTGAI